MDEPTDWSPVYTSGYFPAAEPWSESYLVAIFGSGGSSGWLRRVGRALLQLPRLALLLIFGLTVVLAGASAAATARLRLDAQLTPDHLATVLVALGSVVLFVEIVAVSLREAAQLPSLLGAPTAGSAFGRWMLGWFALLMLCGPHPPLLLCALQLTAAAAIYGWTLPSARRAVRYARRARAALPGAALLPRSPGALSTVAGAHGRQLVVGHCVDGSPFEISGEGAIARIDPVDVPRLVTLQGVRGAAAIVARVTADGAGYRSAGVRLDSGGLPIFVLEPAGAEERLRRFRRRLRLVMVLEGARIGAAVLALAGAFLWWV